MKQEQCEKLLDYFNGALIDEEQVNFESHLASCKSCQAELREWTELTEGLPYAVEEAEPPAGMKQRILGNVLAEQQPASAVRKTEWQKPLLAAALLVSLLGNAYWLMKGNDTPQQVVVDQLDRTVSLQPADSTHAEATAMLLKKKDKTEVLVQASGLQALQSKQVYQVWLLKGGKPYRAGTFVPNEKGDGAVAYSVPEEKWDTIAITIEPDAENEAPEGPIIFSHAL